MENLPQVYSDPADAAKFNFQGRIAKAALYSKVLTDEQVETNFNAHRSRFRL